MKEKFHIEKDEVRKVKTKVKENLPLIIAGGLLFLMLIILFVAMSKEKTKEEKSTNTRPSNYVTSDELSKQDAFIYSEKVSRNTTGRYEKQPYL